MLIFLLLLLITVAVILRRPQNRKVRPASQCFERSRTAAVWTEEPSVETLGGGPDFTIWRLRFGIDILIHSK